MIQSICRVTGQQRVARNIFVLSFESPELARATRPGQFVNVRVNDSTQPLLRRPFSVYRIDGDNIEILYNVVGSGTTILSTKSAGDMLDIIGALGHPFNIDGSYEIALLVGGGLGVAPLPILTASLTALGKPIDTFLGARTADQLVSTHLTNLHVATDDGTDGYHGTVVELVRSTRDLYAGKRVKVFACGPNPMLAAISAFAAEAEILCEVSLESAMACGFGICQGCPVERVGGDKKYALVCKDGTVFDTRSIRIPA
jgi:dihydroorotate dehydrogenase electron transfer subunit